MPQNIMATKVALSMIYSSSMGMVSTTAMAVALTDQLNQTHNYLYMDIPIWVFFVLTLILSAIGAFISVWTDLMQDSTHRSLSTFLVGFLIGCIGAFVILPTFTTKPSMPVMMITGLILSFCGTVLVHNLSELLRSNDAKDSMNGVVKEVGVVIKDRAIAVIKALMGSGQ